MTKRTNAILVTALALAGLAGVARTASAQDLEPPRSRQGYYMGFGIDYMLNNNWEDGEGTGLWTGGGFNLSVGQLITRRFGLGLLIESGSASGKRDQAAIGGLSLDAHYAIAGNLAFHLGSGVGFLNINPRDGSDDGETRGTAGAYYLTGLSYDFFPFKRLTGGLAVTPNVRVRYLPGDTQAFVALFSVDFLWWTGLPRDQLQLPDAEAYKRK